MDGMTECIFRSFDTDVTGRDVLSSDSCNVVRRTMVSRYYTRDQVALRLQLTQGDSHRLLSRQL